MYDGKPHTLTATATREGSKIEYRVAGGEWTEEAPFRTDAGTTEYSIRVTNPKYDTVVKDGYKLTVTKRPVTLTSASDEKVYDGDPLTNKTVTVGGEGFVSGEGATYDVTGSQTEVGNSKNTFTYELNEGTKADNYEITVKEGTLTVTEYAGEITVTTTGGTFEYDGQPHGADVAVSTLPKGYKVETAASTATATHVAEGEVKATADRLVIVNASGKDVTDNLNIKKVDGTIEITKAPLVITSASGEKVYDGTPLTKNNLETDLTVETLKNGETIDVALTGSQTEVGTSANTIEIGWAPEDTAIGGQSETDEAMLAATADDDPAADEPGDDAQTTATARKSDYDVTIKEGNLTVTKAQLTVKTGSAEKVYDGKPLTCDEAEITGFAEGETVTIKATGSQTEVGSSTNTYSIDWGDVDPNNYEIVKEDLGTLTVTAPAPPKTTPAPRTGDMSNMTLPILGILAALILMVILFVTRKRNKEN
jgi:LPXTG-motif cell wall-anchored protein